MTKNMSGFIDPLSLGFIISIFGVSAIITSDIKKESEHNMAVQELHFDMLTLQPEFIGESYDI